MFILGQTDLLYKIVHLDEPPMRSDPWHRTIFVERDDGSLSKYSTVIIDGILSFRSDHGLTKEIADASIEALLEEASHVSGMNYIVYDFTKRSGINDQLSLIDDEDMPTVLGCTKDELEVRLKWKV